MQEKIDTGVDEACQELIEVAASRWAEEEGDYRDDVSIIYTFTCTSCMNLDV